jgi:hypothetical protein
MKAPELVSLDRGITPAFRGFATVLRICKTNYRMRDSFFALLQRLKKSVPSGCHKNTFQLEHKNLTTR